MATITLKSKASTSVSWLLNIFIRQRRKSSEASVLNRPNTTYLQSSVAGTEVEYQRLDDIHNAIKGIQDGALSFMALGSPKSVLDLGCGSAAWAIQAAQTFPKAVVTAVDIIPCPKRNFPKNLRFKELDLCEPFPPEFKPGTFDIIHARLIFIHLPNYKEILEKTIELLKPGGWLLVTDVVVVPHGIRKPLTPTLHEFFQGISSLIASTGGSPCIGQELGNVLGSFPQLVEVNVKKICVPISRWQDNSLEPALREFSAAMRRSMLFGADSTQFGISGDDVRRDLSSPDNDIYLDMYFTWSQRLY